MTRNIFAFLLVLSSFSVYSQDDMGKSLWVSAPVKIDGKPTEWKLPLKYYDAGTKLFFAFSNDDKNIYICFQAPDQMSQAKIMRAGMEIYLNVKGKHKVSVSYPLGGQPAPVSSQSDNSSQENIDRKNRRTSFILQNTMMEVKGFETKNGLIPINDSSGINAAINWDESEKLTYEVSIPLKEWLGTNYSPADISKDITLEIEVNAVKRQARPAGGGENGFAGGGRRGRTGGGGMHHERSDNPDEENPSLPGENKWNLFEKGKMKEKFILAQNDSSK